MCTVSRVACVIALTAAGVAQQAHISAIANLAGSSGTQRPKSVETGAETYKKNQGFLTCAVSVLSPEFRHDNTDMLFGQAATMPDTANIFLSVGHGGPGLQCTGMGDGCPGHNDLELGYWNKTTWQSSALRIRDDFQSMKLLGCEVGKGQNGLTLLHELADTIQMPVRAPDSFVYCDPSKGIYLEDGARWVEVFPKKEQPTVSPPVTLPPQITVAPAPPGQYKFNINGEMTNIPAADVQIVDFEYRGYRNSEFRALPNSSFRLLKEQIDFAHPLIRKGIPAAIVTGRFHIQYTISGKKDVREFALLNDRLAADNVETDVYYRASDKLEQAIEVFLK
jgi:hypothetical protein